MEIAKILVGATSGIAQNRQRIPARAAGLTVSVLFADSIWDSLTKTVVFRGAGSRIAEFDGKTAVIPWEVLAEPGVRVYFGIYGTDSENGMELPLIEVYIGTTERSTDPQADPSADPSLPVWAHILAIIGDLDDLTTEAKTTLVAAINEAVKSGGGSVDEATVWEIVDEYLQENPPAVAETDPTVPAWAKAASKPSYSKSEVGLGNLDNVKQYSDSNPPPYPVKSVNGKTGAVTLNAAAVGADPAGTASAVFSAHNTDTDAHNDLRLELKAISDRLNAFFDSDDSTLDELSEIVAYITSNKTLIDSITTSKVNVSDIINNLTTNVSNKPLSAAQGVALKGLIDTLSNSLSNYALKSSLPTKVSQLTNDKGYLTDVPAGYATEEFVTSKIAEAELGGEDVDLSGYALKSELPKKTSQLTNDSGFLTDYTETDPTVPAWAKAASKPSYSKSEVGLGNVENVKQYSASNPPPYPVASVNNKTGAVTLNAAAVGADPAGTASGQVSGHNSAEDSHSDIRLLIAGLTSRLNALANSTDEDLDQLSELVAYIKNNKSLIDGITTGKVNVSDIVNNLTTSVTNKPLSAAQGVALKKLIDAITVPTKVSQLTNDSGFITDYEETDPTVPAWAKAASKPSYSKSEVGLGNVENVKQYSASNPPPYPVKSVNGKTGAVTLDAAAVGARPSTWMPSASDVGALPAGTKIPTKTSDLANDSGFVKGSFMVSIIESDDGLSADKTPIEIELAFIDGRYVYANYGGIQLGLAAANEDVAIFILNGGNSVGQFTVLPDKTVTMESFMVATEDMIPTKTSDLINDSGFLTDYTETDPTVPAWAKAASKPSYSKSEVGLGNVDNVKQYSASNPPPYPVTSVNGKTGAVTLDASAVGARPSTWTPTAANVGAVPATQTLTVTGIDASGVSHSWTMYGVAK